MMVKPYNLNGVIGDNKHRFWMCFWFKGWVINEVNKAKNPAHPQNLIEGFFSTNPDGESMESFIVTMPRRGFKILSNLRVFYSAGRPGLIPFELAQKVERPELGCPSVFLGDVIIGCGGIFPSIASKLFSCHEEKSSCYDVLVKRVDREVMGL